MSINKKTAAQYSAKSSSLPTKVFARTKPGLCTKFKCVDMLQGYLSIFTGFAIFFILITSQIILLPSILAAKMNLKKNWFNAKLDMKGEDDKVLINQNISQTETGSLTALKTLSARSTTARLGINPDYLAPKLMAQLSLYGPGLPGSHLLSQLYLLLVKWNFILTRRFVTDQLVHFISHNMKWGKMEFGECAYLQCRTCWIDDCLDTFLNEHCNSNRNRNVNVVALGAGYDTRSYRFAPLYKANYYEVDARGTQVSKMKALRDAKIDEIETTFVSCDFVTENWLDKLIASGMDAQLPTFVIWEGVTMYLKREVVQETLSMVAERLGQGSCIAFDYLDSEWALSPKMVAMSTKAGEPLRFGMHGDEPEKLIKNVGKGLSLFEHVERDWVVSCYLPKHYDNRPVGFLGNFGGFIIAGRS